MVEMTQCPSLASLLDNKEFDYIVVGGGTAGLVVASRLSEDAENNVLVIEAGASHKGDPKVDTPGLMTTLYGDTNYDWNFTTEPQTHVNKTRISMPRGRMLGGSSAMNFSAVIYPSKTSLDTWKLLGNPSWSGDDMAQYFRKFQTFHKPSEELKTQLSLDYLDLAAPGYEGPMPVCFGDGYGPFNEAWVATFKNLGYYTPGDPIHGEKLGVFNNPFTIDPLTRERGYSASAYYDTRTANRANLHVLTETVVEKVVVEKSGDNVVATGVQVNTKYGGSIFVASKKEVILSAGVFKSPQILELSGIGNKELLAKEGIKAIINLPGVGENFQDHPLASLSFEVADDQISGDILRDPNIFQEVLAQYQKKREGPLSGTPLSFAYLPLVDINGALDRSQVEAILRQHLDGVQKDLKYPSRDLQYSILREQLLNPKESSGEYMYLPLQLNYQAEKTTMGTLFSKASDKNFITIVVMINHPFSRGTVHIGSADPNADPMIDPDYLSHPLDLEILARHMQYLNNIVTSGPMESLLKPNGARIPSHATNLADLSKVKELAKERLFTAFHPSGTCAMMSEVNGGVVNERLVVHGTNNLRVVDASIFPIEPLGNIQALVYAVAEKASDIIRRDASASN